jgi:hypothetical protein
MAMPDAKKDKEAVGYVIGGKDDCGDCRHYEALGKGLGSCTKVEGQVRPWMWCRLFAQKEKSPNG